MEVRDKFCTFAMYKRGEREGYGGRKATGRRTKFGNASLGMGRREERDVHWEMHCDWRLKRLYAGMAEREAGKALLKVKK